MKEKVVFVIVIILTAAFVLVSAKTDFENSETFNELGLNGISIDINLDEFLSDKVEYLYLSGIDENGVFADISAGSNLDVYNEQNYISGSYLIGYDGELYKDPALFYNGIAAVCIDGKYGYINKNYSWIVDPIYDFASDFKNGYGVVYKNLYSNDCITYIFSKSGECVYQFDGYVYGLDPGSGKSIFENGYSLISKNGRVYILDKDFNETEIESFDYPTDGVYEIISQNGTIVFYKEWEKAESGVRSVYKQEYCIIGHDGKIKYRYVCSTEDMDHGLITRWPSWYSILSNGTVIIGDMAADKIIAVSSNGRVLAEKSGLEGFDWNAESIGSYILLGDKIYDEHLNYISTLTLNNDEFILSSNYINNYLKEAEFIESNGNIAAYMLGTDKVLDEISNVMFYRLNGIFMLFKPDVALNETPDLVDVSRIPEYINKSGITVYLNNVSLTFDIPPITENDRTLVPMRAIFEALGADVKWDNETNTATAEMEGTSILITIDSGIMYKNGEAIPLDAPAQLIDDGYTFVPLRAVSEAFGCMVKWTEELQRVDILKSE